MAWYLSVRSCSRACGGVWELAPKGRHVVFTYDNQFYTLATFFNIFFFWILVNFLYLKPPGSECLTFGYHSKRIPSNNFTSIYSWSELTLHWVGRLWIQVCCKYLINWRQRWTKHRPFVWESSLPLSQNYLAALSYNTNESTVYIESEWLVTQSVIITGLLSHTLQVQKKNILLELQERMWNSQTSARSENTLGKKKFPWN